MSRRTTTLSVWNFRLMNESDVSPHFRLKILIVDRKWRHNWIIKIFLPDLPNHPSLLVVPMFLELPLLGNYKKIHWSKDFYDTPSIAPFSASSGRPGKKSWFRYSNESNWMSSEIRFRACAEDAIHWRFFADAKRKRVTPRKRYRYYVNLINFGAGVICKKINK